MPQFDTATTFSLFSVDHDRVLLDSEVHSTRHLIETEETAPPKQMKFSFTVNGEAKEALLTRDRGAFTEDAQMTTMNENGEYVKSPLPEQFAYYSEDRNWVLTFHGDNKFDGLMFEEDNSKIHHFVGQNGKLTVDGNVKDYFPGEMKGRGLTSEANGIDYWDNCHGAQSSGLGQINIGMAVGKVMIDNFGTNGAISEYNSYMTLTNTIYERQMDIRLNIADTFFATTSGAAPWAPSTCTQDIQTQLNNMRFWNPPSSQTLWHLVDDCFGFSGGILGIAYLGVLCQANNVGVSYYSDDQYTSTQYPTWATVAHELGHNFDAQHSFEQGQGNTGGIMDYGYLSGKLINGEVQFNSRYRETEVCREVNTAVNRGCVIRGVAASPTGQLTVPETIESEIVLDNPRSLNCAKHRLKKPVNTDLLKRFNEKKTEAECKTACAEREACNGFVTDREGWCELIQDADGQDFVFSSKFSTNLCVEGSLPESFTEQDLDDVLETANLSALKQDCCTAHADEIFLGMNMNFESTLNSEQCQLECIQNSQCEAASYDSISGCLMYGGRDFSHTKVGRTGATAISCDRACISATADSSILEDTSINVGGVVGGFAFVAVLVAAIVGTSMYVKKRKADKETVITTGEAEGEVYKATL